MAQPKLSPLEMRIMETLWTQGALPIRDIQEAFPKKDRPAYTTIQTTVYRLEEKKALRRTKKVGNAHIFESLISRQAAQGGLIDDFLKLFGGQSQPVMAHLVETGKFTMDDVHQAETMLRNHGKLEGEKAK